MRLSLTSNKTAGACPVRAGNKILLCLREFGCDPTTPVSDFRTTQGLCSVSASNIITIIKADTTQVGASRLVFSQEDVGMLSLRSDGAMAMHTTGVPDLTIITIV